MLDGVTGQIRCARLEQGVKHKPRLVQAQVFHLHIQHLADQRAGTITAHHIAGMDCLMVLQHPICHRQLHLVPPLLHIGDFGTQPHLNRRKP